MPKPRTKRQAIRDERKQKKREKELELEQGSAAPETERSAKRQRIGDDAGDDEHAAEFASSADEPVRLGAGGLPPPEREFFGMLSEGEQEYFRQVDQELDVDDFPDHESRQLFLAGVFEQAQGKELKLACSQSCSRLMERLILMSNTRQKKKLFEQFAGHFVNLIQHRFASHCCETLFLQSAPIITRELGGDRDDMPDEGNPDDDQQPLPFMEELFLLTLDELEGHLAYLLTDKFASHTLRVLLVVLSGRPLDQAATKSLIHSKKKERISAPWAASSPEETASQLRPVPSSFTLACKKIVSDSVAGMNPTELRVLATHPTGNPVLQLLLELDMTMSSKSDDESSGGGITLLWKLLPDAPGSLKDSTSPATDFVNSMLYDRIGSRLLEVLITTCPGKVFKALYKHIFSDRIQSFLRNDVASYPAMRVLNRLSKEDLQDALGKILPELPKLVSLSRLNVVKTLFERCQARQATSELDALTKALCAALGGDYKVLIPKLCLPEGECEGGGGDGDEGGKEKKHKKPKGAHDGGGSDSKSSAALVSHGAHLATAMLAIPGPPRKAAQTSLSSLPADRLLQLAESSAPTSHVAAAAFATPSHNKIFHKVLAAALRPHVARLALSEHGNKVACAIVAAPSRGGGGGGGGNKEDGIAVPFHLKEQMMAQLGERERELRESFEGRRAWRAWKGDLWRNRRADWVAWAKEADGEGEAAARMPQRAAGAGGGAGPANGANAQPTSGKRKRDP